MVRNDIRQTVNSDVRQPEICLISDRPQGSEVCPLLISSVTVRFKTLLVPSGNKSIYDLLMFGEPGLLKYERVPGSQVL